MATLSTDPRTTKITLAASSAGPFDLPYRVFDSDALTVYINGVASGAFTLTADFLDGFTDDATVTLSVAQAIGTVIVIDADLAPRREDDFLNGPAIVPKLNIELARIWSAIADVKRDTKRGFRALDTMSVIAATAATRAGKLLQFTANGLGIEQGITSAEITTAASNAAASASAAAGSATAADNSAIAAELDAVAAANSADDAEAGATAAGAYTTRAAAVAANVPTPVQSIRVLTPSGHVLAYVRNTRGAAGIALTTNGGAVEWMPDGNLVTPNHWAENTTEGTTDMRTAIQAAVDFVEDQGGTGTFLSGGAVTLLGENYRVTGEIVIDDHGVIIRGMGGQIASRITNTSATANTIRFAMADPFNGEMIEAGGVYSVHMWNTATDPTAGAHVYIDRGARIVVSDCYLINHFRGVDLLGTGENCIIRGCNITQGSNTTALQSGSAGIMIRRRNVASGVVDPAQDSTDSLWYTECNTVEVTNCNIVANSFGMQNCIYVDSVDGLKIVGGHTNGATNACIALIPAQDNIGFTNIHATGHHCDPKPATTQYGILVADLNTVGGSTMGDVIFSGCAVSGATLDGVRVAMQCKRFAFTGGSIKGSGRHHVLVNSAAIKNVLIANNHMFNSDTGASTTDAAIYASAGVGIVITGNTIETGTRGIDVGSGASGIIEGNIIQDMSETPIFVRTGATTGSMRIGVNDIGDSFKTVASALTISPYPGVDSVSITGTTSIGTIRLSPSASIPGCSWDGRRLILRATSSFTVSHGSGNITLAGAANFAMAAGNRLWLEYDNATATWYELARAA